ncbi:BES1/BZR1 transcription factor [Trema orientale]|uniref:Protein BZR1 homolog n=1 Tax=Trema orientale TaxID=63057 RepID=A0A2P5FDE3_TREOI|nr:BES1/BZR1 transcription factor [Trema orientale]
MWLACTCCEPTYMVGRFIIQGCKPLDRMDIMGGSTSASPCSSYQQSPCASYNPSPASSSFPSPVSSHYTANAKSNNNININSNNADPNSLIPWLKTLTSASSSSATSKFPHHLFVHSGSISAPVTPPLSSPTCRTPRNKRSDWDDPMSGANWACQNNSNSFQPSSNPQSPGRQVLPDPGWLAGLKIPQSGPSSPTFSLVSKNPFGFMEEALSGGGSRMWTPGQSGTCSPAIAAGLDNTSDVPMSDGNIAAEFAFGSNNNTTTGLVKPWEGERIEECVSDDLELTLGSSRTR